MQQITRGLRSIGHTIRQRPVRWSLMVAAISVGLISVGFLWPKSVDFSYAGQTCTRELTLLPKLHRQATDSSYKTDFVDAVEIAGIPVVAKSVCFVPTNKPEHGDVKIATSLWGSWFAQQLFTLKVGAEPKVDVAALKRPVPTTKPVSVSLDQPDSLHSYQLVVDEKSTECSDDQTTLFCDIEKLRLAQGKQYKYQLTKQFSDETAEPISIGTIETLKAVKITKGSLKNGQVVYDSPSSFSFQTDKPVQSANATLESGDDSLEVSVEQKDKNIRLEIDDELERETEYVLVLDQVEAVDGSTLVDPYQLKFKTSGGPAVSEVSVGGSRVDANARVLITFDQELSDKQDVASLASLKGGQAAITKVNARQIAIQLQGLGRCTPFTISVKGGLLSKYDIKNDKPWSFDSRTICYTTTVYGTSLQGRPLVAYHFGNSGPVTLYTGAIHGNEVSSMYMMQSWIAELEANPGKIGKRQVVVIPNINPDGVAAGTRNNSRNVNLSRNFPTSNWVKDIDDTNGPVKGGGGSKPLSEPEAAALARFTQSISPRLLVSYHAIGSLVVGDPGGYSAGKAARYAGLTGYRDATGQGGTFDYDITGAYEDWTYRNIGIPSMIVELGSYSYHDINHHRVALWTMLDS